MRMKAIGTKYTHRIGWVRGSPKHPVATQIASVKPHCKVMYNSSEGDTIDHVIQALRPGNVLVMHDLSRIGENGRQIGKALAAVFDREARIFVTGRGGYIDSITSVEVAEAIGVVNGEARAATTEIARKRGKLGGKPKAGMSMSDAEARKLWKNPKLTNQEAADAIGVSVRTCYRSFGDSGRPAGWPKPTK